MATTTTIANSPPSEACYCSHRASNAAGSVNTNATDAVPAFLLCHDCTIRRLADKLERRRNLLDRRDRAVEELRCRDHRRPSSSPSSQPSSSLSSAPLPDPNLVLRRLSGLRNDLAAMRRRTDLLAVELASAVAENDGREDRIAGEAVRIDDARAKLEAARRCLLRPEKGEGEENDEKEGGVVTEASGGGLVDALSSGSERIRSLRFHLALRAFDAHRLEVVEEVEEDGGADARGKKGNSGGGGRGVGKIGGLPLPHAGPTLYGVLPPAVLASSLRSVASLTCLVARCLGVVLPHPILLRGGGGGSEGNDDGEDDGDIIYAGASSVTISGEGSDDNTSPRGDPTWEYGQEQPLPGINDDGMGDIRGVVVASELGRATSGKPSLLSTFVGSPSSLFGRSARKAIALASSGASGVRTAVSTSTGVGGITGSVYGITSNDSGGRTPLGLRSHGSENPIRPKDSGAVVSTATPPKTKADASISDRVRRASFAVLIDTRESKATEYALDPPRWNDGKNGGGVGATAAKSFPLSTTSPGCATTAVSTSLAKVPGDVRARGSDRAASTSHSTASSTTKKKTSSGKVGSASESVVDRETFRDAEERFAAGLQLLQNDIVALCFRAGVDASELHPAEAVLLNLGALMRHCRLRSMAVGGGDS